MSPHRPPFKLAELKIEVTDKCSLACVHCSSDAGSECLREIATDDCTRIISEAAGLNAEDVVFSGGEPFLWDGLELAVEAATGAGMSAVVYTTGNAPRFAERLGELAKSGLKRAVFSLFGATQKKHEMTTRRRGSFDVTIHAIQEARKCGLTTEVHFVPFRSSFRDLPSIAALARELGVTRVSVLRLVPQGRAALLREFELDRLQNLEMKHIIEGLRRQNFDIRTGSPYNFLMLNEQPACRAAIDRAIIGPDLRVIPCDAFKQIRSEEIAGTSELSSLSSASLSECWTSSPYLATVRRCLTTPFAEPCSGCSARARCLSGCLAQKFIAYGDVRKRPDPMCLMHRNGKMRDN